jgi:hypothetical protein
VAVFHLLQYDRGGRRLFLAGLGGEGESARTPVSNVMEELLAGSGGVQLRRYELVFFLVVLSLLLLV